MDLPAVAFSGCLAGHYNKKVHVFSRHKLRELAPGPAILYFPIRD